MKRIVGLIALLLCSVSALAQSTGSVSITATPTSGNGVVNTTVTWSTTPPATSCALTGGGIANPVVAASGTLTDTITKTTTYGVACNWTRTSNVFHWVAPTTNTDGTPLTDLASYTIWYAPVGSSSSLSQKVPASATTATVTPAAPGTYIYDIVAVNSAGLSSPASVSLTGPPIGTTTASGTATTTVITIPSAVTGFTVQ